MVWAENLHRWGVEGWVANCLEALGPLSTLFAQLVYLGQPLFCRAASQDQWRALAEMLEDDGATQTFVAYLREDALA